MLKMGFLLSGVPFARIRQVFAFAGLVLALSTVSGSAHFQLNTNTRIMHIEHLSDGLRVFLRLPMPYLVADLIGTAPEGELPQAAPYTNNTIEQGAVAYYLDLEQLLKDPEGLGELAAQGHWFSSSGRQFQPSVRAVRVYPRSQQPLFATLSEAARSFEGLYEPQDYPPTYVGDTVVDVLLEISEGGSISSYSVSSTLNPSLEGQDDTANLLLDYFPGGVEVYRARGLLSDPIQVTRSSWTAAATFVKEGVRHILEGLDHLLFVICLVLGANRLGPLITRVTGFTVGHSVTLIAGFLGFAPTGAWFIPTVETGIALSIIYAAYIALQNHTRTEVSEYKVVALTTALGLLHGFGFSFMLREILQVNAPNLWISLLAFNVGVELGQLAVIALIWPLFVFLRNFSVRTCLRVTRGVGVACILIAAFWTVERGAMVVQVVFEQHQVAQSANPSLVVDNSRHHGSETELIAHASFPKQVSSNQV
jgi:HupE/UreJ protein